MVAPKCKTQRNELLTERVGPHSKGRTLLIGQTLFSLHVLHIPTKVHTSRSNVALGLLKPIFVLVN